MLDLAARLSVGEPLPGGARHGAMGTILMMVEDGLADTVAPRLINAGGDMTRIGALETVTDAEGNECLPAIPDSLPDIENVVACVGARLLVIDPIMSYLGSNTNSHRDQDVRRALTPLAAFADRTGIAVVVLRHLNKMTGGEVKYRGQGTIGFIGIARSGLIVATDPDDSTRNLIASSKSNLGPVPPTLAYRLVNCENGMARVQWEGVSAHTAQTVMAQPMDDEEKSAVGEAMDWLRELLANGRVFSKDAQKQAREAGIADRTLRRAREALGVVPQKSHMTDGAWVWELPLTKLAKEDGQETTMDKLAPLDTLANFKTGREDVQHGQGVQDDHVRELDNFELPPNLPVAQSTGPGYNCCVCGAPIRYARAGKPLLCARHSDLLILRQLAAD
jgi:hypothetical protein